MPLVTQGSNLVPNSRSHTALIKSPGDAPAGEWIVDPNLPGLFDYPYAANRRLSKVVIPKGSIVAVGPAVRDYNTRKWKNVLTFADGTVSKLPVGVAPYSYFRRFNSDGSIAHDQFGGDDFNPVFTTREYIEVPYLPNPGDVYTYCAQTGAIDGMKMMWGCATNVSIDVVDTDEALQAGDFVKPGKFGKFVKWYPEQRTVSASVDFSHSQEFNTRFLTQIVVEQSVVEYELEEPALAIYSASIGDVPLVYGTDYELTADGKFKILTTQSTGAQIDVWAHKTTYHLEHSNAWDISVTAQGTELDPTEFTYTPATGNVVISIPSITLPWATTITIEYCAPGAMQMNITDTKTGDSPVQIVGQVLEMKTDLPPLGWLKYVEPEYEGRDSMRETNPVQAAPIDGPIYDPDYTWPYTEDYFTYKSPDGWKTIGGGFPGLTDAQRIALTTRIQRFTLGAGEEEAVCILDPAAKIDATTLLVLVGGSAITTDDGEATYYDYDASTQVLTVYATAAPANATPIQVSYKVDPKSLIGTPPSWDYAGSIGAVGILLKL